MKKIVLLVSILFCICSCEPYTSNSYEITISYYIDGNGPKTEVVIMDCPESYKPAYLYDGETLRIFGISGESIYVHQKDQKIIYQGSLSIEVESFDYKLIRAYKTSQWNGREIKTK